jgi:hypothetical protein
VPFPLISTVSSTCITQRALGWTDVTQNRDKWQALVNMVIKTFGLKTDEIS